LEAKSEAILPCNLFIKLKAKVESRNETTALSHNFARFVFGSNLCQTHERWQTFDGFVPTVDAHRSDNHCAFMFFPLKG
jgi:hypothetical protein